MGNSNAAKKPKTSHLKDDVLRQKFNTDIPVQYQELHNKIEIFLHENNATSKLARQNFWLAIRIKQHYFKNPPHGIPIKIPKEIFDKAKFLIHI